MTIELGLVIVNIYGAKSYAIRFGKMRYSDTTVILTQADIYEQIRQRLCVLWEWLKRSSRYSQSAKSCRLPLPSWRLATDPTHFQSFALQSEQQAYKSHKAQTFTWQCYKESMINSTQLWLSETWHQVHSMFYSWYFSFVFSSALLLHYTLLIASGNGQSLQAAWKLGCFKRMYWSALIWMIPNLFFPTGA